jgi:hypothetical protein
MNWEVGRLLMPPFRAAKTSSHRKRRGRLAGRPPTFPTSFQAVEKNQGSQPFVVSARFVSILQEPTPVHLDLGLGIWLVWWSFE